MNGARLCRGFALLTLIASMVGCLVAAGSEKGEETTAEDQAPLMMMADAAVADAAVVDDPKPATCDNLCNIAKEFKKGGSDGLYVHCHACPGAECNHTGTVVCHDDNTSKNPGHNLCYDKDGKPFNCDQWIPPGGITVQPINIPDDQAQDCGGTGTGQQAIMDPGADMGTVQGCSASTGGKWVNCKQYACDGFAGGQIKVCECEYPKVAEVTDAAVTDQVSAAQQSP